MSREVASFDELSSKDWNGKETFSYNGKLVTPEIFVGRGMFGSVYRCSVNDGTKLALKVVTSQDEDSFLALQKEALISKVLYGQGEFSGKLGANQSFYALLPFFEGVTLATFFRDYKPDMANQEESKAVLLRVWVLTAHAVFQLCERYNLQHGDLCAHNIMVSPGYNQVNLIDFQRTQNSFFNLEHVFVGQFLRDDILKNFEGVLHFSPVVQKIADDLCKISDNISLKEAIFRITTDFFSPLSAVVKNKEWCVIAPVILKIQLLAAEIKTALQEKERSKKHQQLKVDSLKELIREVEKQSPEIYVNNFLLPAKKSSTLNTGFFNKSSGVTSLELVLSISPGSIEKK